jgi:hypothetical protein
MGVISQVLFGLLCPRSLPLSLDSGYDFGYFVKILSGAALPTTEDTFFQMLKIWFPRAFDVKSICRAFDTQLKGGLADVAEDLGVRPSAPIAAIHQTHSSLRSHEQAALISLAQTLSLRPERFSKPAGFISTMARFPKLSLTGSSLASAPSSHNRTRPRTPAVVERLSPSAKTDSRPWAMRIRSVDIVRPGQWVALGVSSGWGRRQGWDLRLTHHHIHLWAQMVGICVRVWGRQGSGDVVSACPARALCMYFELLYVCRHMLQSSMFH